MYQLDVEGYGINVTNPEKLLWPEVGIRKIDFIEKMIELAPFIIRHAKDMLLTTIRYPDGVNGKSFFQKSIPEYAPEWVETAVSNETEYILLNSVPTLVWLATQAALEFHTSFNSHLREDYPFYLVFDLDPSKGQNFEDVTECAGIIHETLESLSIKSFAKTSGATGLQIYIPTGSKYDYEKARKINEFFGAYFSQKYPEQFTIERIVNKRGKKLYFDYLQMWYGKTITTVYSPRATPTATVSMPIEWSELGKIKPGDFTLLNAKKRLDEKGDLFKNIFEESQNQDLDSILVLV